MTTKEKVVAAAKFLLAERGYVVIGILPDSDEHHWVGEIVHECFSVDVGQPFQLIAETNWQDWIEQCRLVNAKVAPVDPPESNIVGKQYFRALTD